MLQQLGEFWRWLQEQSPVRQAMILAAPIVAAMLLVLGGLIVWSVSNAGLGSPRPTPIVNVEPTPGPPPPTNQVAIIATTAPSPVAQQLPTVLVPSHEPTAVAGPPTATPVPEPTATPTPEPPRSARVVNTDGEGANLRRAPSVSAQRIKLVTEGTVVELVGGEQHGDGYTWRNIRDVDGSTGYVIVDYLQPIEAPPGATPILPPPAIRVEEIISPVARGAEATLTIVTRPGVRCELRALVFGPSSMPTEGLEVKRADGDGVCSWTWKVPEDVVPGTWRYQIQAGEGESRAVREVPVVIT